MATTFVVWAVIGAAVGALLGFASTQYRAWHSERSTLKAYAWMLGVQPRRWETSRALRARLKAVIDPRPRVATWATGGK